MDCLFSIIDSKLTWSFVVFQEEYALMVLHAKIDNKWKYLEILYMVPRLMNIKNVITFLFYFPFKFVFL